MSSHYSHSPLPLLHVAFPPIAFLSAMLFLIACGTSGTSGPVDWSKEPLSLTLDGSAEFQRDGQPARQAFTISVPNNFEGEYSRGTFEVRYRTGGRIYTPHIFVNVGSSSETLAEALGAEKDVFAQEETAEGYYFARENGEPTDLLVEVGKRVGDLMVHCRVRVTRTSKNDSAEVLRTRLPKVREMCNSIQLK